jgi:hypothetical protein
MGLLDRLRKALTPPEPEPEPPLLEPDPYDPTAWLTYGLVHGHGDEDYENDVENLDTTEGEN